MKIRSGRMARVLAIVGSVLIASLVLTIGLVLGRGETLIDILWVNRLSPVRAGFNRDEASPVRVALRADGAVNPIQVTWSVIKGNAPVAGRDTLIAPPVGKLEREFTVTLPPLPPGQYILSLVADPAGVVQEKNEVNNKAGFAFRIPNGCPVRFRCDGPEGSSWDIQRIELNRGSGIPFPDSYGTRADTTRSNEKELVVNGVEPGPYSGVLFAPPVNRMPILISFGTFEMPDPPKEMTVSWPRTTPYLVGRPTLTGSSSGGTVGGDRAAPQYNADTRVTLDGSIRNPTVSSEDVQWLLRFTDQANGRSAVEDTLISLGALATESVYVTGRTPLNPGMYLIQAEVRVRWPASFDDLGDEDRVNSHVLPIGWIEVLP